MEGPQSDSEGSPRRSGERGWQLQSSVCDALPFVEVEEACVCLDSRRASEDALPQSRSEPECQEQDGD